MLRPALILLAMAAPWPALAAGCDRPAPLRFAPCTSGAIVEGGVPRGQPDCWTLNARAGQTLEAHVTSTGNNAVIALHPPGWRLRRDASGQVTVEGKDMFGPPPPPAAA